MKKILFGITSLTLGGAERVLVDLANKLCEKYDITIFTIYANGELEKELNSKVKLKSLYNVSYKELSNIKKHFTMPLKVLLGKRKIYKKFIKEDYDVEIAFLEGPITRLFSVKNKKTRKIAWIHNDISKVYGNGIKSKLKRYIDKKNYCKYETLVFVSIDNMKKFREVYKDEIRNNYLEPVKKEVIYNYLDKEKVLEKAKQNQDYEFNKNTINFVTVARLVPQKAIDRIINVHEKLIKDGFKISFYVIGEGPEENKLQTLINEKKVQDTFFLLGKKENPYPYIKNCDYFCLLSYFEGYGMVLEEAKILNKPIIITDTAAREAVNKYGKSIVLENDEEKIYYGLKQIIKDKKLSEKITQDCMYDNSKIIDKIVKLVGE